MLNVIDAIRTAITLAACAIVSAGASAQSRGPVHDQFTAIAPYMSMDIQWVPDDIDAPTIARVVMELVKLSDFQFDAHPALETHGRPYTQYIAGFQTRVVPGVRADDDSWEHAFMEAMSRLAESEVFRRWQIEFEQTARDAYAALIPVARLAAAPTGDDDLVSLTYTASRVWAVNESGRTLSNVTVAARFHGILGQASDHYFFVRDWPAGERIRLRVAGDWAAGVSGTTSVWLETLSDHASSRPRSVVLADHLHREARSAISEAETLVDYNPAETERRIDALRESLAGFGEYRPRLDRLSERVEVNMPAFELRTRRLGRMQTELAALVERRDTVLTSIRQSSDPRERERLVTGAERLGSQIAALQTDMQEFRAEKLVVRATAADDDAATRAFKKIAMYKSVDTREQRIARLETFLEEHGDSEFADQVRWQLKLLGGGP